MRIERHELARLLGAVTKVVESRNTIPILSSVRLVADGDVLTVTATDLDIEVTASAPCEGDLAVCLDAKTLTGIVNKAADDFVDIDQDGTVKSGRSRFTLPTLPVSDFPDFSVGDFDATFDADMAALFAPVQFAMSNEETRYYLNGIFLHVDAGKLVAVATDGHRLSRNIGQDVEPIPGVIVPRKTVGIIPKGSVTVSLSDAKIRFVAGDITILSKLIDATYPDYKRILPTNNDKLVTFGTDDMAKAVARVSVISTERGRAVKLSIADEQITLAASNPEAGSAAEDIVVGYSGAPIEIGFNGQYMTDMLGALPAGGVNMAIADPFSPALFTTDAAPGLLCVLMPMRVYGDG
jgi:DNA polymerase-3 subunit beta